jgi:hypothetical protein
LLFLLGTLWLATTGCSQSFCIAEGTLPERPGDYQVVGPATGTSYAGYFYILDLFPVHFGPTDPAGAARDDALVQNLPANALVGAALDSRVMLIPIPLCHLVLNVTSIEGTAVKQTVAAPEKPQPQPEPKAPKTPEKKKK